MNLDFTTIVGVDEKHAEELRLTWPTWERHRSEILDHPLLLICDGAKSKAWWHSSLHFLNHRHLRIVTWNLSSASQREKMLSGLVLAAAGHIDTPWYLKLDTDAVALSPSAWIDSAWFMPDERDRFPVFVASPWGYTKPGDMIERLDMWADGVPALNSYPRLNLSPRPGTNCVAHQRIISWCFFGRTASLKEIALLCGDRLPVPSHDTLLWYVAKRRADFFRRVRMKRYGWTHVTNRKRLAEACRQALEKTTEAASPPSRRGPAKEVARALARTISSVVRTGATGAIVDAMGAVTSQAFQRQRPDWTCVTWPVGELSYATDDHMERIGLEKTLQVGSTELDFIVVEGATIEDDLGRKLTQLWPRLRTGGILGGINYGHPRDNRGCSAVSRVVNAFARSVSSEVVLAGHTVWLVPKLLRCVPPSPIDESHNARNENY